MKIKSFDGTDVVLKHEEFTELFRARTIFICYAGSLVHGTKDPTNTHSDVDVKGAYVDSLPNYLGLSADAIGTHRGKLDHLKIESEMHEIRKFARLAAAGNPTVLETLFTPKEHVISMYPEWEYLIHENRRLFLSRMIYKTFRGYARDQFDKMELGRTDRDMGAKRKELVEKFGYDTKNAMHIIRLTREGMELAKTGEMNVSRTDADELINIRRGCYSLEQVKKYASELITEFAAVEKDRRYANVLPETADTHAISKFVTKAIMMHHRLTTY
jgi:predicted nucleotidyltransferase